MFVHNVFIILKVSVSVCAQCIHNSEGFGFTIIIFPEAVVRLVTSDLSTTTIAADGGGTTELIVHNMVQLDHTHVFFIYGSIVSCLPY